MLMYMCEGKVLWPMKLLDKWWFELFFFVMLSELIVKLVIRFGRFVKI